MTDSETICYDISVPNEITYILTSTFTLKYVFPFTGNSTPTIVHVALIVSEDYLLFIFYTVCNMVFSCYCAIKCLRVSTEWLFKSISFQAESRRTYDWWCNVLFDMTVHVLVREILFRKVWTDIEHYYCDDYLLAPVFCSMAQAWHCSTVWSFTADFDFICSVQPHFRG